MNRHPCLGMAATVVAVLSLPQQTPSGVLLWPGGLAAAARPGAALRPPPGPTDLYICLPADPGGIAECWRP